MTTTGPGEALRTGSPMARVRATVNALVLVLAFGALAAGAYQTGTGRWHATPVLSGSMRPGLQPGDVVLTKRVPVSDLHVRDVIVFHRAGDDDQLTVHRIVELRPRNGSITVTTRGDANSAEDPEDSVLGSQDTYRVERVIPLVGYPAVWLSAGTHGVLTMGLGVLLLVAAAVLALRRKPAGDVVAPAPDEEERRHDTSTLSG